MGIETIRGAGAEALLCDPGFCSQWTALACACPWATGFQSVGFVSTWYACYRSVFEPMLVFSRDANGDLDGLLPLARSLDGTQLIVAGGRQAEYVAWISRPQASQTFIAGAVEEIGELIPGKGLNFHVLPQAMPMDWLSSLRGKRPCHVRTIRRPLIELGDPSAVKKPCDNQTDKTKLRRLKKVGPLELKRITDPEEYASILDRIIELYDTRRLAMDGLAPFQADPCKRVFSQALMCVPGLNHATILTVGRKVASVHVSVCSGKEICVGLIAHDPLLAKYSPGRLHMLMLPEMLIGEGFQRMDLTPGGEIYKESFANGEDELSCITIYRTAMDQKKGQAYLAAKQTGLRALRAARVTPADARLKLARVQRAGLRGILRAGLARAAGGLRPAGELKVYHIDPARFTEETHLSNIRRDALFDLLAYQPGPGDPSPQEFMSCALRRLERGQHCYTCVQNGRLVHCGWLVEQPSPEAAAELLPGIPVSPDEAIILDLKTAPEARRLGLAWAALAAMLRDSRERRLANVIIGLPADNAPMAALVEKAKLRCFQVATDARDCNRRTPIGQSAA
jgi:CelD/BcsL family acetyltransferase involved in cellulose biosynthesis/ribosomal protein S18 acetylase RimI-like enzyme